jgi:heat shock protein HtpX
MAQVNLRAQGASSSFFAKRVVLALLLTAGFYALVLAVIALCGGLLYWILSESSRVDVRLIIVLAIVPLLLIASLLPRRDRFVAPGPKLDRAHEPVLFAVIDAVAKQTGQKPPAEVYVLSDANAFVTERGGVLGIATKRVMGIGMPLLQTLTVSQLRGVLAHEFGHFQGGDTRLGGWIYKLRGAIGRTIDNLGFLQAPFSWYGKLFMRVTQALSRQQEFEADRLAAGIVGSTIMADALRTVRYTSVAFSVYWQNEVMPLLNAGYRPPVTEGFLRYLETQSVREMIASYQAEAASEKTDPYDTHPAMHERIAAIHEMRIDAGESDARTAITLVKQSDSLELALLLDMGGVESLERLRVISWEDAGQVYRERWRHEQLPFEETLAGLTIGDLGEYINSPKPAMLTVLRGAMRNPLLSSVDARDIARGIAADAVSLALSDAGWTIGPILGQPITMLNGERSVQPFTHANAIVKGDMTPAQWRELMAGLGVADLSVG